MKLIHTLLLPALAVTVYAAGEALVYTFDRATNPSLSTSTGVPATISPENARLVLAQRLGLSQFYDLGDADDETIRLLNQHTIPQAPLGEGDVEDVRRLMIIVEGVKEPGGMLSRSIHMVSEY